MIRLVGNEPSARAACLAGLNLCFPAWGDANQFEWCYNRPGDPCPADLLVAETNGTIIAGLAVVYRRIGRDSEPQELVGVLSGAWTHPDTRGLGLLGQLLDHAAGIARGRGATLAIAFITGERESVGQVQRRSAAMIESMLFASNGSDNRLSLEGVKELPHADAAIAFVRRSDRNGLVSIRYDPQSWRNQMVNRTVNCRVVQLGDDAIVVFAQQDDSSMILDALSLKSDTIVDPEAVRAAFSGQVTTYVSDPKAFARFDSTKWVGTMARIFFIPLTASRYLGGEWLVSSGDRI